MLVPATTACPSELAAAAAGRTPHGPATVTCTRGLLVDFVVAETDPATTDVETWPTRAFGASPAALAAACRTAVCLTIVDGYTGFCWTEPVSCVPPGVRGWP